MEGSWPLTKRSRSFLACDSCKAKKSKCDSNRPVCGRCKRLGSSCVYTSNGRDKRIANRESRVTHPRGSISGELRENVAAEANPSANALSSRVAPRQQKHIHPKPKPQLQNPETPLRESLADELATNAFDQRPTGEIGYFGSSTNHGFFSCLSNAILNLGYREVRTQEPKAEYQHEPKTASIARQTATSDGSSTVKGSYNLSHPTLLARFFDTIGEVLPYIDKKLAADNLSLLNADASTLDPVTQSWQALLNMMIAYALHTMDGPSPEPYYRRGLQLLYGTAVHLSTLQTLQALLLLSSFEQNIRRSMVSLSSHSLAVRTAYHLGLHSPTIYTHLNSDEKRLRARLWLALVNQDRALSCCLGRPCLIAANHVRKEILKVILPDEVVSTDLKYYCSSNSAAYFNQLTLLYEINAAALDDIYLSNVGHVNELSQNELVMVIMGLSARLEDWHQNSEPFAMISSGTGLDSWYPRSTGIENFAIILSLHYHRTILIIHGGLVMHCLDCISASNRDPFSGVTGDVIMSLLKRDLAAARDMHYVISHILQAKRGFLTQTASWWTCNYSAFCLSLHLFGLWLLSGHLPSSTTTINLGMERSEIAHLLQGALNNLEIMGGHSMLSSKAYQRLQRFFDLLKSKESDTTPRAHLPDTRSSGPIFNDDLQLPNYGDLDLSGYVSNELFGYLSAQDMLDFNMAGSDYGFGGLGGQLQEEF